MKINAFVKKLLKSALQQTAKVTAPQNAVARENEQVPVEVAGRPPRRDINQGGWPGRNA